MFLIFMMFTYQFKQLLFSGLNLIVAHSNFSKGLIKQIGLEWAMTGPISIRVKFENIFEVNSLT